MAKIYETQKDFEQDKLKDQSNDMHLKSANQGGLGLASMLGATIVDDFNPKKTGGLRLASVGLSVIGVVEIVKSILTAIKARDLHMQKERLGPQVIAFPPEMGGGMLNEAASYSQSKYTQAVQPTTLLEQAARPESTLERK